MNQILTTGADAPQGPSVGLADALQAARAGWLVHPIGTEPTVATCDEAQVARIWEEHPDAGVAFVRMSGEALLKAAQQGFNGPSAVAELCRQAAELGPVERDRVLQMLKTTTGLPFKTLRAEISAATGSKFDDLALARSVIEEIGRNRILFADNCFWIWDECGVWKRRDPMLIRQRAQLTIERSHMAVTGGKVSSVTDLARNETYRADHRFNLGSPNTVNCLNGELELVDGQWKYSRHRRENFRTSQIPIAYAPEMSAPLWDQFLTDIFRDDSDRIAKCQSLMELIGYTLMSHANHEKFVMLIGSGANGKSVLLHILTALLGPSNVAGVQPSEFGNKFQRAHLHMKLANIVTELRQGEVIADAELKAITSGETTTVENKHASPFEMRAFATCWFGTNHMPHTRDFSDALFRRATILTFNRTFTPSEQDPYLKEKLASELPSILTRSLVAYQHAVLHGWTVAPSSEAAKAKWRREADQVALFVEECCIHEPNGKTAVSEIYRHFRNWAASSGVRQIVGKQAMGDRLERLGFGRLRSDGSWITGLQITHLS